VPAKRTVNPLAPPLEVTRWLNSPKELDLGQFRGRVVLLHAFQMLCPGCVSRGLPQAQRAAELFKDASLTVLGLHTVFEHHEAMQEASLRAFLHEYRIRIPVGIDAPGEGKPIPVTMEAYGMRGTPTTILIDGEGRLREHWFGAQEDMLLGAAIQRLLAELGPPTPRAPLAEPSSSKCSGDGCSV